MELLHPSPRPIRMNSQCESPRAVDRPRDQNVPLHGECVYLRMRRKPGAQRRPLCAVVGGAKDTTLTRSRKQAATADRERVNPTARQSRIRGCPGRAVVGGAKDATPAVPAKRLLPLTQSART